jgi:transposase
MKEYLLQQRNWLTVERLPGYAPDLNPVETLWEKRELSAGLLNSILPLW